MGLDDDADCVEHVWRLAGFTLGAAEPESFTAYGCARCPAVLTVGPGGKHPATA